MKLKLKQHVEVGLPKQFRGSRVSTNWRMHVMLSLGQMLEVMVPLQQSLLEGFGKKKYLSDTSGFGILRKLKGQQPTVSPPALNVKKNV